MTEWAIRANERDRAIETAWQAVESGRPEAGPELCTWLFWSNRIALKEKTKGVEALVDEFKRRNDEFEPMTTEMQRVWIDLLRELGRYDDAIALFRKNHWRLK